MENQFIFFSLLILKNYTHIVQDPNPLSRRAFKHRIALCDFESIIEDDELLGARSYNEISRNRACRWKCPVFRRGCHPWSFFSASYPIYVLLLSEVRWTEESSGTGFRWFTSTNAWFIIRFVSRTTDFFATALCKLSGFIARSAMKGWQNQEASVKHGLI